ncbi:hypothetical protein GCM10023190_17230 [Enteractinococcus fodinae]
MWDSHEFISLWIESKEHTRRAAVKFHKDEVRFGSDATDRVHLVAASGYLGRSAIRGVLFPGKRRRDKHGRNRKCDHKKAPSLLAVAPDP